MLLCRFYGINWISLLCFSFIRKAEYDNKCIYYWNESSFWIDEFRFNSTANTMRAQRIQLECFGRRVCVEPHLTKAQLRVWSIYSTIHLIKAIIEQQVYVPRTRFWHMLTLPNKTRASCFSISRNLQVCN